MTNSILPGDYFENLCVQPNHGTMHECYYAFTNASSCARVCSNGRTDPELNRAVPNSGIGGVGVGVIDGLASRRCRWPPLGFCLLCFELSNALQRREIGPPHFSPSHTYTHIYLSLFDYSRAQTHTNTCILISRH